MNKIDTTVIKSLFYENWSYLVIIILSICLFQKCNPDESLPQTVEVTVPEVKGSFEEKKPEHFPFDKSKPSTRKENLQVENPINPKLIAENEKLKKAFEKASDSIKKLQFAKAIELKNFTSTFENDTIKIDINGIVQGQVKEIKPSYVIKEQKVEVQVKPKETVFRLLGGVEVGGTTQLNNFVAKGNLIFQNRKGNTTSISYDTNKTIWIGKSFSIFNVKR